MAGMRSCSKKKIAPAIKLLAPEPKMDLWTDKQASKQASRQTSKQADAELTNRNEKCETFLIQ